MPATAAPPAAAGTTEAPKEEEVHLSEDEIKLQQMVEAGQRAFTLFWRNGLGLAAAIIIALALGVHNVDLAHGFKLLLFSLDMILSIIVGPFAIAYLCQFGWYYLRCRWLMLEMEGELRIEEEEAVIRQEMAEAAAEAATPEAGAGETEAPASAATP